MEEGEAGGFRLGKKPSEKSGEVDYKTKAGTAWSHSFLNQKPWHPLSYPNQRRKWIAEQTHTQKQRRAEEIAREYAQEQEFLRQTALINKKEKEKLEMMRAVSFMYVKPPGYDAESAKAAEISSENRNTVNHEENASHSQEPSAEGPASMKVEKKKSRPKDVFGRALPTEEQFQILKNAPKLDTGVAGRSKPFGVEIRNVKCLRCGSYGHQSGDRECPMKDAIMPNEQSRLKRDDPLTAMLAQSDSVEPLKWELRQKPGMSPPHGGFDPDDPNQQIVAEDIFDEYGGFLAETSIPDLLIRSASRKKKKSRTRSDDRSSGSSGEDADRDRMSKRHEKKKKKRYESSSSDSLEEERSSRRRSTERGRRHSRRRDQSSGSVEDSKYGERRRGEHRRRRSDHR